MVIDNDRSSGHRFVQIIPAPVGMFVSYKDPDGSGFRSPILCLALTADGDIQAIDFSPDGVFDTVDEARNFDKLEMLEQGIPK